MRSASTDGRSPRTIRNATALGARICSPRLDAWERRQPGADRFQYALDPHGMVVRPITTIHQGNGGVSIYHHFPGHMVSEIRYHSDLNGGARAPRINVEKENENG